MKKILPFLLILYAVSIYADDDLNLISTKYSSTKSCKNFKHLKATDDLDSIDNFSIPDENYLTISLKNKYNQECYRLKYYPDMTPFIHFRINNHNVKITEMSGTASSGNWFDKTYKLDIKHQKLKYMKTSFYH